MAANNLLEEQARIRGFSDDILKEGLSRPQGQAPFTQFLGAMELSKRAQQRRAAQGAMAASRVTPGTVVQDLVQHSQAIGPAQPMPQQSQAFANGGLVTDTTEQEKRRRQALAIAQSRSRGSAGGGGSSLDQDDYVVGIAGTPEMYAIKYGAHLFANGGLVQGYQNGGYEGRHAGIRHAPNFDNMSISQLLNELQLAGEMGDVNRQRQIGTAIRERQGAPEGIGFKQAADNAYRAIGSPAGVPILPDVRTPGAANLVTGGLEPVPNAAVMPSAPAARTHADTLHRNFVPSGVPKLPDIEYSTLPGRAAAGVYDYGMRAGGGQIGPEDRRDIANSINRGLGSAVSAVGGVTRQIGRAQPYATEPVNDDDYMNRVVGQIAREVPPPGIVNMSATPIDPQATLDDDVFQVGMAADILQRDPSPKSDTGGSGSLAQQQLNSLNESIKRRIDANAAEAARSDRTTRGLALMQMANAFANAPGGDVTAFLKAATGGGVDAAKTLAGSADKNLARRERLDEVADRNQLAKLGIETRVSEGALDRASAVEIAGMNNEARGIIAKARAAGADNETEKIMGKLYNDLHSNPEMYDTYVKDTEELRDADMPEQEIKYRWLSAQVRTFVAATRQGNTGALTIVDKTSE